MRLNRDGIENLWQRAAPSIKWLAVAVGLILLLILGGSLATGLFDSTQPQPAPTEEIAVAEDPTNTPTATQTATAIPTTTNTPSPTQTATETPTATNTPSPSPTIQLLALAGTPIPQPVAAIFAENAGQVTELARSDKGEVARELAYSPDGKLLMVGESLIIDCLVIF